MVTLQELSTLSGYSKNTLKMLIVDGVLPQSCGRRKKEGISCVCSSQNTDLQGIDSYWNEKVRSREEHAMNIECVPNFVWKTRKDQFLYPREMETRHLYMTLVLIWNHTMPADAVIHKSGNWIHHSYTLGSYYDKPYLTTAIGAISRELFKRTDMEEAWQHTLLYMHNYLYSNFSVRVGHDQV